VDGDQNDPANPWVWERDYIYRSGVLLAEETPTGVTFLHPDHLGTPRLYTGNNGRVQKTHHYFPYGQEIVRNSDLEPMRFTGQERDFHGAGDELDDLDYMHARYYNPMMGRFLSTDPKVLRKPTTMLARWNRYTYAANNPIKYTDPDGREIFVQVHRVVAAGVRTSSFHTSVRIEPNDQERFRGDRRFVQGNPRTGRLYATLGAGSEGGRLVSNVNRDTDVDLTTKTEEVRLNLAGRNENEVIDALFAADSSYGDNLDYDTFPADAGDRSALVADDGSNSNSYTSGVVTAVGLTPPVLQSNTPGYDQPVPEEEFEPE